MIRSLCIDPAWSGGTPPDILFTRTIYTGARWAVRPDQWDIVGHYLTLGLTVSLVLDKTSGDPAQYADWATSDWMRSRVKWFVGNEMDGIGEASWTMTPSEYDDLWRASRVLHGERWIGGMCSGIPSIARNYLKPDAAGLSVHIYTLNPYDAAIRTRQYKGLGPLIWIGEWHPSDNYRLMDYSWPNVNTNDFCFSDAMVPGLGLWA